ncbi:hypothetical protein L0V05_16375 [Tabrizicola sp. J26]|uniref:hypothetical protein n=1 Tax=Alitabrizicola rongguiensis TaxID=2909234 RepID=UPI001F307353|nr:hypothetical protein [Tabrizicola rongguiensis]MCF1710387.1 hypothetical protein [Tabrizicola rongguiensis]
MIEGFLFLIAGLAALYITLWLFILLPARMAEARGRSAIGWVLVSLFFSPLLAVFLLWVLGDAPDRNA